jgi:hypothetical protein
LKVNHRNSTKNKSSTLSEYDISILNLWIAGYRGNHKDLEFYVKKAASIYVPPKSKYRWSTSRVDAEGNCLDCKQKRCPICNGCPVDVFEKVAETSHCQRCICSQSEEHKPLKDTDIPLSELVRKRQGSGFKKIGGLN